MSTIQQTARSGVSARRRPVRAIAVGGAVLAASLLWLAARALGVTFRVDPHHGHPPQVLSLPLIIGFTLFFCLLGWASLALLERLTRSATTIWTALAVLVLLLSFVPIISVSASVGTKTALSLIHCSIAAVLIPAMRRGNPTAQRVHS
jgi:hypothetical protein